MGSKFGYLSKFSSNAWEKMKSEDIKVGVTAAVTAEKITFKMAVMTEY